MLQTLKHFVITSSSNVRLMWALLADVFRFRPQTMVLTVLFMLFRSISAGISLLMILPLLRVIGFSADHATQYGITKAITTIFQSTHVPLNLHTVLMSYIIVVSLVAIAAYGEQRLSSTLQQKYIHHLRSQLYSDLLHTTWPFFLQQKSSTLLHSLTTQIQTISAANVQLLNLMSNTILLAVYTFLAFFLSWQMTLIAILCAVLLLSMMLPLHRLTSLAGRLHLQQNQTILQTISEQLSAIKMIKGSGFEDQFVAQTMHISSSLEQQNQHLARVTALTKLLYSIGAVIMFSALLYTALTLLTMSLSSLILLLVVFARLLPMVSTSQQNYQRLLHHLPSYSDVKQLIHDCVAHQEIWHKDAAEALFFNDAITVKNLRFSYQKNSKHPIIQELSCCIKKNTTTAIIGPSGAGKSTLADLIVGLLEPTAGQIYIDKQPLDKSHRLAWRRSVAYVTQDSVLFNASIRQNLELLCQKQSDEALWAALRNVAAADFVASLDDGLDTMIGDRGVRLSGGERQRIALARALLINPQLLVLDESTSSLDSDNVVKIQHLLTTLKGKITILIISHQRAMSAFAHQQIDLSVAQGTKEIDVTVRL